MVLGLILISVFYLICEEFRMDYRSPYSGYRCNLSPFVILFFIGLFVSTLSFLKNLF